jgi:hypothetical protein
MGASVKLTPQQEREVAVRARCDPRTVRAFLAGGAQSAMTRASVEAAIRQCGFGARLKDRRASSSTQISRGGASKRPR